MEANGAGSPRRWHDSEIMVLLCEFHGWLTQHPPSRPSHRIGLAFSLGCFKSARSSCASLSTSSVTGTSLSRWDHGGNDGCMRFIQLEGRGYGKKAPTGVFSFDILSFELSA